MPPEIKTILVPVDFSPGSDCAVEWAQAIGQAFEARVILLHVVDTSAGEYVEPSSFVLRDELRREAGTAMAALAVRAPGAEVVIRDGSPRHEILGVAASRHADLVVMGTHGRTGLAHALFGSVAEHVVRHAAVPVFTIRCL